MNYEYMRKKVFLISEYLNPPFDEGIKKTVYNLYNYLDKTYVLQVISRFAFEKSNIHIITTNALFISKKVKKAIREFEPDVLIYFPFASGTFAGYLRMKVFSYYGNSAKSVFIALQPKVIKPWQRFIVKFIKPKFALSPSPTLIEFWNKIKVENLSFPLLTDLDTFKPIAQNQSKKLLRKKYNLPLNAFIISHMGHLNEGRNLKSLIPLQKTNNQVVIVGSSSTPKDSTGPKSLKEELEKTGIIVIDGYIEKIEEIYQLSDLYIFPVVAQNSSIGMPLSILEARACGIPVITTDFGSISEYLGSDNNGIIYSEPANFVNCINEFRNSKNVNLKKSEVNELNHLFYQIISNVIEN